jgi:SAGA-associated factor 29
MGLLEGIKILAGLREASEEHTAQMAAAQPAPRERNASGNLKRKPTKAGGKSASLVAAAAGVSGSTEDNDEGSAAPSPRISISSAANRLNAKDKSHSRAGSIPATREASVKIEDGAESVASSTDVASNAPSSVVPLGAPSETPSEPKPTGGGSNRKTSSTGTASGASRPSNRLVLAKGEIVFCRHDFKNFDPKKNEPPEGEGILCRVTSVIGEGKQRRYEVQDADNTSNPPPPPQRASIAQLIPIPVSNKGLGDLPKGKSVLAEYPETTTFYKAEVSETWRGVPKNAETEPGMVRLMFQDDLEIKEVERRFVLSEK